MRQSFVAGMLACSIAVACTTSPETQAPTGMDHGGMDHGSMGHSMTTARSEMPLFNNLGTHSHKISTKSGKAQAYFDQGYRLLFNFNHAAAISSFEAALRLDANCAMCWWGIGFALGPNINMPMAPDANVPALHAVEMAQSLKAYASPAERDYIDTLAERCR